MNRTTLAVILTLATACSSAKSNEELRADALLGMKGYIAANLDALVLAATELKAAAPAPQADGWVESRDRAAIEAMKAKWKQARIAYEHTEGAIAVLFPELDV